MSEGANVILVVVDRFSKYAHFVPLKHQYTAAHIGKILTDHIIKLHGVPLTTTSDRDTIFTSTMWREIFRAMGTKL